MTKKTESIFIKLRKLVSPIVYENEELNINKIFKPLYLLLRMAGLFPYSIKYNESKHKFNIIYSSIYMSSLSAMSIMMVMYGFCVAHAQYLLSKTESSSLTDALIAQFNYLVELSTLVIGCNVAYICAFLNRYKYVHILNTISSIWTESTTTNRYKILGHLRFQVNVVVLGSLLVVFILQLLVNSTRNDSIWKIILVTFSFIFPQMIQMINLAFHYVLVVMVAYVLSDINQQITTMAKRKVFEDLCLQVGTRQPLSYLRNLEKTYTKAFEIKQDLNGAFQAPNLCAMIQCFHSVVSEWHMMYHGLVDNSQSLHNIINCSIWSVYQLLKVYSLAYSGSLLNYEAMKIGRELHNIPVEKQDMRMLLEVQHFSSLMVYQGFLLTIYGLFPLNATLISKMIASVTMYLIILVQFDKSDSK